MQANLLLISRLRFRWEPWPDVLGRVVNITSMREFNRQRALISMADMTLEMPE